MVTACPSGGPEGLGLGRVRVTLGLGLWLGLGLGLGMDQRQCIIIIFWNGGPPEWWTQTNVVCVFHWLVLIVLPYS